MKKLQLEDIAPERAAFFLKAKKKKYYLRPVNLTDNVWMKGKWGNKIGVIFEKIDMPELSKIIYRLMEDKSDFLAEDIDDVDDEGEPRSRRVSGPEKLCACIQSISEQIQIFQALMSTIGISQPLMDKMVAEEIEGKVKKKLKRVGGKSSTRSPRSTGTRSRKSA